MKSYFLSLVVCFVTAPVFAGFFIEPHLGFESSYVDAKQISTPTFDSGYYTEGLSFGSRAGYKIGNRMWFAADLDMSSGKNVWVDSVTNATAYDFSRSDLYLLVGAKFPGRLRGWVGYGFSSTNQIKTTAQTDKTKGTAIKVGLAYEIFSHVSFTGEYHLRTMTDYETTGGSSVKVDTVYSTYKDTGYRVGFSFPFGL